MKIYLIPLLLVTGLALLCRPANAQNKTLFFELEKVSPEIISPVGITHAGDGSGRLFVVQQTGKILILNNGNFLPEPFLDLSYLNLKSPKPDAYSESGLLSMAFHPQYKQNGRFFVYFGIGDEQKKHKTLLAEFKVSKDPNRADKNYRILLELEQPQDNHNGGGMAFGPDGMLYLGIGDGGGAGDKHGPTGNAQNTENLLGSIIRIDVNTQEKPYTIPADNPLYGKPGRDELWAWGLRNAWQFSFDAKTGELYCGDVGQNKYEEINIIKKGANYGWRAKEGTHPYDDSLLKTLQSETLTDPIAEYDHSEGMCVIGGVVYRGKAFPQFHGRYLFADWKGVLFYLEKTNQGYERYICPVSGYSYGDLGMVINAIGTDEDGEIYLATQGKVWKSTPGAVYRIKVSK